MKRLERREYAHVEGVDTGDELTSLARAFNVMVDGLQERDRLRATFGKYMTPSVMEHLLKGKVTLGGETLAVTVLFSDIRSFSTLSEDMGAQAVVAMLNEYFSEMVDAVMSEDGVVDKYIGDGIMVVFGAPVPKSDDAVRAVRAAVKMRRGLARLNARLEARGLPPLAVRHRHPHRRGGRRQHRQRGAHGVHRHRRRRERGLPAGERHQGRRRPRADERRRPGRSSKGQIDARPLREITVKGRAQPVMTYEVLGIAGESATEELAERLCERRGRLAPTGHAALLRKRASG